LARLPFGDSPKKVLQMEETSKRLSFSQPLCTTSAPTYLAFEQYFHYPRAIVSAKDPQKYPDYHADLLVDDTARFVKDVLGRSGTSTFFRTLLSDANVIVRIVGDAGGTLKSDGRFIRYPSNDAMGARSLADFFVTLTHAMGVPNDTFGAGGVERVQGPLSELLA
jgi:hypothetical protein